MAVWKINDNKAELLKETSYVDENISESTLEGWVQANPEILGEPLLVFGRQVPVEGLGDTIDLLALDVSGAVVIIEMKRADIRAPVDMQGLRYASYVSRWADDDLEEIAAAHFSDKDEEQSLEDRAQEFSDAAGSDEELELNHAQRVFIVGRQVRDRLGSVALWLREQGVDITLVEVHPFRDGQDLYLEPVVIIPAPTTEEWEEVGAHSGRVDKPWIRDGATWHRKRGGEAFFTRSETLLQILSDQGLAEKVSYAQQDYIAVRKGEKRWLSLAPRKTMLRLRIRSHPGDIDVEEAAARLGLEALTGEEGLKDMIGSPSTIDILERRSRVTIRLRLREDYDVGSPQLLEFLREAADAWCR